MYFQLPFVDLSHGLSESQTGEYYQHLRCGAGESCLGYYTEITSPMNTYSA